MHVAATYEQGIHILRPDGIPIEVRRWRDGKYLVWDYVGFIAKMELIADANANVATVLTSLADDDG